ncbi:MAG: invasion associated locus B family protein [Pseudomonadota bacterium]
MIRNILISLGVVALMAGSALAQESQSVAAFKDWTVFTPPGSPKECFMVSPPVSSKATRNGSDVTSSVRRGDIRLFVTMRPEQGVQREVSFTGGYPFAPSSTVDVAIGNDKFTLSVGSGQTNEWAWPASPERDQSLISAMRRGSTATLTARSARGTVTADQFSLIGFTAALEKIEELCK